MLHRGVIRASTTAPIPVTIGLDAGLQVSDEVGRISSHVQDAARSRQPCSSLCERLGSIPFVPVSLERISLLSQFHGSVWEYYQDAAFNARAYTATQASLTNILDPTGSVPKNVFDQFGFNIGGPVYLPKILTGKKKLFFFDNFERTTRRQLISGQVSVPDVNMITGNFSEVAGATTGNTILYDPAPTVPASQWFTASAACPALAYTSGYLNYQCRPSFTRRSLRVVSRAVSRPHRYRHGNNRSRSGERKRGHASYLRHSRAGSSQLLIRLCVAARLRRNHHCPEELPPGLPGKLEPVPAA
jgi:hypothetical protein